MLPFAIFFLLVGWGLSAFFVWCGCKPQRGRTASCWVMAICFFALGAIPLIGCLLDSAKVFAIGLSLPIGVLLAFLSVDDLLKYKWCTVPVEAYVKELVPVYHRRGVARFAPVFFYRYLEKNYEEQSLLHYSKRYLRRSFSEGERCEIFVDPRCPERCVDKRQRPYPDLLLMFFALCFLAVTVILICMPAESVTMRA